MKTVYFVRHGESEENAQGGLMGRDSILSARGIEQAESIADRATRLPVEVIVSSTKARAKQTANIIQDRIKLPTPIVYSDLLVERKRPSVMKMKYRTDEGMEDLEKEWHRSLYTQDMRVLDGENFLDLRLRAHEALAFLANRSESEILVATHGYFLLMLAAVALFDFELRADVFKSFVEGFKHQNTGITLLQYNLPDKKERWRIITWNDHAHLG